MFHQAPRLRSIIDQDGAVVFNSARNEITTLDAMGGFIWRQIELGLTQHEIVCRVAEETGVERLDVENDLQEFFRDLASRSLLREVSTTQRLSEKP
jgi:hypothetical protein